MLKFIFLAICITLSAADHIDRDASVRTFNNVVNHDGSYQYQFESTNGIAIQESGVGGYYATGSSQHYTPDGTLIQLTYTADENGFQPQGAHLPTPPPTPDYILRAIEWIKAHPEKQEKEQQPSHRPYY